MTKKIPLIYLPTQKACEEYGVARTPTKLSNNFPVSGKDELSSNDNGTFDFINGEQFTNKRNNNSNTTDPTITKNTIRNPSTEYVKDNKWVFDVLKERRDNSFSKDQSAGNNFNFTNKQLEVSSNEIVIEVLTNKPYTISPEYGQDGLIRAVYKSGLSENSGTSYDAQAFNGPNETVAVFRVLPEGDEFLKFSHSHDWGEPDGILKKIMNVGVEAGKKLSRASEITSRAGGEPIPEQQYRMDINDKYMSSMKPSLNFKFVLFTKNDFINDIFLPIMTLCYYSSPSRTANVGENAQVFLNNLMSSQKDVFKDNKELLKDIQETERKIKEENSNINMINRLSPGVRFLVTDPPPFFRVWHASGLFYYPRMSLNEVSYTFHKPFYNISGEGFANDYPQEGQTTPGFFEILKNSKRFKDSSFPLYAEVNLNFEGIDPLFFDDFASLMYNLDEGVGQNIIDIGVRSNNRFTRDQGDN